MMWHGWGPGGWGMGVGWIFMALFWLVIAAGAVALVRWMVQQSDGRGRRGDRDDLQILRERYARGEISREEYEQVKRDLES